MFIIDLGSDKRIKILIIGLENIKNLREDF